MCNVYYIQQVMKALKYINIIAGKIFIAIGKLPMAKRVIFDVQAGLHAYKQTF